MVSWDSRRTARVSQPMAYCPRPVVDRLRSSRARLTASAAARRAEVSAPCVPWNAAAASPANLSYSAAEKGVLPLSRSETNSGSRSRPRAALRGGANAIRPGRLFCSCPFRRYRLRMFRSIGTFSPQRKNLRKVSIIILVKFTPPNNCVIPEKLQSQLEIPRCFNHR